MIRPKLMVSVLAAFTLGACAHGERDPAGKTKDPSQIFSGRSWQVVSPKTGDVRDGTIGGYTDIFAVTDLHGHLLEFRALLEQAQLIEKSSNDAPRTQAPNWIGENALLILLGDNINSDEKGVDDSAQLLTFIHELSKKAETRGSRVISLLGNHEAWAMGHSRGRKPEDHMQGSFLDSVARQLGLKKDKKVDAEDLREAGVWDEMTAMPLGAVVGNWLFIHGGYLNPRKGQTLVAYASELNDTWVRANGGSAEDYATLGDDTIRGDSFKNPLGCPLAAHQWYTDKKKDGSKRRAEVREHLEAAGISVMFVGHEKDIFDEPKLEKEIVLNKQGWLLKLDAGLKEGANGELLHCPVKDLRRKGDPAGALRLTDGDNVLCRRIIPGDRNGKRVIWLGHGQDED